MYTMSTLVARSPTPSSVTDTVGTCNEGGPLRPLEKSRRDPRPLPVRVYEQLRDLIVTGELAEDVQLVQEQVAESLGVSRTPVRDALNRLAHEGLVTWNPGRGYLVNGLSTREVREIYQVRRLLEVEATRLACGQHGTAVLARLAALIEDMAAADPQDAVVQFDLNRQFHRTLVEPCDNHVLLKMLDTLWDHPVNRRITRSYLLEAGSSEAMIDEHRELLAAAAEGSESKLLDLTAHHLMTGYDDAMHALDETSTQIQSS